MNKLPLALLFLVPFLSFSQVSCDIQIYVDYTSTYQAGERLNSKTTQLDSLILDSTDIIAYDATTFTFELKKEAIFRLQQLNLNFKVFTIVVKKERILAGWFWGCSSSIGMRGYVALNLNCNKSETLSINYCIPRLAKTRKDSRDKICPEPSVIGCWTNSFEENKKGTDTLLMRPCYSRAFPSSRFRYKVELKNDSSCEWLVLASNDSHYMKHGYWTYNKDRKKLIINNTNRIPVKVFTVLTQEKNLLLLKKELVRMQHIPINVIKDSAPNKYFPQEPIRNYDSIIPIEPINE